MIEDRVNGNQRSRRRFLAVGCLSASSLCLSSCPAAARTVILKIPVWMLEGISWASMMPDGEMLIKAFFQEVKGGEKQSDTRRRILASKNSKLLRNGAKLILRTLSKVDIEVPDLVISKEKLKFKPINGHVFHPNEKLDSLWCSVKEEGVADPGPIESSSPRGRITDELIHTPIDPAVSDFITDFYLAGSSRSLVGQISSFADDVKYFGRRLSKSEVHQELIEYHRKWRYRRYYVHRVNVTKNVSGEGAVALVDFDLYVSNGQGTKYRVGRHRGRIQLNWENGHTAEVVHLSTDKVFRLSKQETDRIVWRARNDR